MRFPAPCAILLLATSLLLPGSSLEAALPLHQEPAPADVRVEQRNEALAFGAKLWVKNRNGAIRVNGWDRVEVALKAEIRDSERRRITLVVKRVGADLDIDADFRSSSLSFSFGRFQSPRCEMTLNVPRRLLGHFRTTNGSVNVVNLEGYARCESTNGDIKVSEGSGEVHAETCNGSLEFQRLHARVKASTTNGAIQVQDVAGGLALETTNGRIVACNLDGWGEGIALETTNGSIDVELGKATGELWAENTNGSLDVKVPGAEVRESGKHTVRLKLPGGGAQKIHLETTNGRIHVR